MRWHQRFKRVGFLALGLIGLLALPGVPTRGEQPRGNVLRIGSPHSLQPEGQRGNPKGDLATMKRFIKQETGLNNEIVDLKDWREVAAKLAKDAIQVGVFQGYEFAWAQEKYPKLKPLAVAVSGYRYPVAYVIVRTDNPARGFGDLRGQSLALIRTNKRLLHLFVDRECQKLGKKLDKFFAKVVYRDNFEDALDDVVDGVVQVTVADRAALESYKQRKPGRFRHLKPVVHSQPFPSAVMAYYNADLDRATLRRLQSGLLNAANKEQGRTMLNMFRLTGFERVPRDFDQVLAQTRQAYPPADVSLARKAARD